MINASLYPLSVRRTGIANAVARVAFSMKQAEDVHGNGEEWFDDTTHGNQGSGHFVTGRAERVGGALAVRGSKPTNCVSYASERPSPSESML